MALQARARQAETMETPMTHKLLFSNPVFRAGINVTVRKGSKWDDTLSSAETVDLATTEGEHIARAIVLGTIFLPFCLLNGSGILKHEHDPRCRDFDGLYDEMKQVYPGFDKYQFVTVVFFEPEPSYYRKGVDNPGPYPYRES